MNKFKLINYHCIKKLINILTYTLGLGLGEVRTRVNVIGLGICNNILLMLHMSTRDLVDHSRHESVKQELEEAISRTCIREWMLSNRLKPLTIKPR